MDGVIEIDKGFVVDVNKALTGVGHRIIKPDQLESVFSSYYYYEDKPSQIASIVNSIIKNHPFGDGNKRTAFVVLTSLCRRNSVEYLDDEDELFEAIHHVANNKLEIEEVVEVLQLKEKGNDQNRS